MPGGEQLIHAAESEKDVYVAVIGAVVLLVVYHAIRRIV
jgi:uncharacterized membrane protein YeaQ/YmgE (transglycosylase-associated protein family)